MDTTPAEVPVFILCGGLGTRIREETDPLPKPMVPVGNKPMLWHVMRLYSHHGFRKFILCLGYKAEAIKSYFLNYSSLNSDFTVDLGRDSVHIHSIDHDQDWEITLAFTGEVNMTGSRISQAANKYLGEAPNFAVTYGDGLTDANLAQERDFHLSHGGIGTVLGVNPPSRFGELKLEGDRVVEFDEKPEFENTWINGGFFFFRRTFLDYLSPEADCTLERHPLVDLAAAGQLSIYRHRGFWACMDTQRDRDMLEDLWRSGKAPWAP